MVHLSSFPAIGLQSILNSKQPPVWALSVLEDSMTVMRESGDTHGVAFLEKEIKRIEAKLLVRCR